MIRFRVLGAVELQDGNGVELRAVLTQPKRLALLTYLAISRAGRFHSREKLLALFWSELDESHARAALSQALYYLRRALGAQAIVSRGSEEVGLDPDRVWCDAAAFERALERGDPARALDLYCGDLLASLHLLDTLEWEQWLESERTHLRSRAAEAAWMLAETAGTEERPIEAARWGHRALELAGDDEVYLRNLIALLERLGDRAGAVRAYEDFAARLSRYYGLEVSPETRKVVARLRARGGSLGQGDRTGSPPLLPLVSQHEPTSDSEPADQETRKDRGGGRRSLALAGTVVITLALALTVFWPRTPTRTVTALTSAMNEPAPTKRLAVLPLSYSGPESEDEYLADGLTEELIAQLSKLSGLRVIARTSVMRLRSTDKSTTELGRELEVDYIIEGSLRRDADRARVTVQLVDTRTEEQLWSETHEAELDDVLSLPRAIAEKVVARLPLRPRPAERHRLKVVGTDNPQAHLMYLRGRHVLGKGDPASFARARGYFDLAIEQDPTYAKAWSGLSDAYDQLVWARALPAEEGYPRALAAAKRAVELDPDLAEAHASLARLLTTYAWDSEAAEQHFRRAIELDPSDARAHRAFAAHLRNHGRLEEAHTEAQLALELDPLAFFSHFEKLLILFFERRYDAAIEKGEQLASMGPGYPMVHFILAKARIQKGLFAEALEDLDRADPEGSLAPVLATRGYIHALTGRRAEAREALVSLAAMFSGAPPAFDRAIVHLGLGEKAQALELIDQAIEERDWRVRLLKGEPLFDPLRAEPRFGELLQRAGFAG